MRLVACALSILTAASLVSQEVQVDAVDKNNEQQSGVAHSIIKTSVHKNGDPIAYKKQIGTGIGWGCSWSVVSSVAD
jgi:hypothetical protein